MADLDQELRMKYEEMLRKLLPMFDEALNILEQKDKQGEYKKRIDDMRKAMAPYKEQYLKK